VSAVLCWVIVVALSSNGSMDFLSVFTKGTPTITAKIIRANRSHG